MVGHGVESSRRIGDAPEGAPIECFLGRHVGRARGGRLVFTCERCGGHFWQTETLHDALELAAGRRYAEASAAVDEALEELTRPKRSPRRRRRPAPGDPARRPYRARARRTCPRA